MLSETGRNDDRQHRTQIWRRRLLIIAVTGGIVAWACASSSSPPVPCPNSNGPSAGGCPNVTGLYWETSPKLEGETDCVLPGGDEFQFIWPSKCVLGVDAPMVVVQDGSKIQVCPSWMNADPIEAATPFYGYLNCLTGTIYTDGTVLIPSPDAGSILIETAVDKSFVPVEVEYSMHGQFDFGPFLDAGTGQDLQFNPRFYSTPAFTGNWTELDPNDDPPISKGQYAIDAGTQTGPDAGGTCGIAPPTTWVFGGWFPDGGNPAYKKDCK